MQMEDIRHYMHIRVTTDNLHTKLLIKSIQDVIKALLATKSINASCLGKQTSKE